MITRTTREISVEREKLIEMKPRVRQTSAFGDDNHDAIDAQIEVLNCHMSEDRVYREYQDGESHVFDSALEAAEWMAGENDGGSPSEEWECLT